MHLKPLHRVLIERRIPQHFLATTPDEATLTIILRAGQQVDRGHDLRPTRFVVVRDSRRRARLARAALEGSALADAPVVIAAFGHPGECAEAADPPLPNSRRARLTSRDASSGQQRLKAHLQRLPPQVWIHRHAMLACTCMMLTAQSLGWDTALVDRFDPAAVAAALALPAETEVVALLAIGHAATAEAPPPEDRELGQIAFSEQFGERWPG